jgi:hypothetical protein
VKDRDDVILPPAPAGSGSCTKSNGNANYSCGLTALEGTTVTLRVEDWQKQQGNNLVFIGIYEKSVVTTCTSQTGVNF